MTEPQKSSQSKSKNALKHGCYSRNIVLPGENAEEFDELHQQIREDLTPDGPLEVEIVVQITQLIWLKRREVRAYSRRFTCDPVYEALVRVAEGGATGIENHLRKLVVEVRDELKHGSTTMEQLRAKMDKVMADPQAKNSIVPA